MLREYFSDSRFTRSARGAESAGRGFELQTLYICSRLMSSSEEGCVFWPESVEDLLVGHTATTGSSVELIQVKSTSDDLTLSDIAPKEIGGSEGKIDALFGHASFFLSKGYEVTIRVVVFGKLGSELKGFAGGFQAERETVIRKIQKMYGEQIGGLCKEHLIFEEVNQEVLRLEIGSRANTFFEVTALPRWFVNTLSAEVRSRSLNRQSLTFSDVKDIARRAGAAIAAKSGFSNQYGKTLFPLSERFNTQDAAFAFEEYKLGVDAQPEHIAAGYDVQRTTWLDAIDRSFTQSDTVIVQGASGQGKSTLCLRYLYDRVPVYCSYMVDGLLDCDSANDIVACLVELAKQESGTLCVYIDGAVGDTWVKVAQLLQQRAGSRVRLLVSIRDDDMNQISVSEKELSCSYVRPTLSRDEAERIFERYECSAFPSFEESWRSFGERGPLMEYTASLGAGESLESMLGSQVDKLIQEGRNDAWLYALYLASVLGAEGIGVSVEMLGKVSGCGSMTHFVERVKNEHLLRVDADGMIGPLHAYRSKLIAQALGRKLACDRGKLAIDAVKCASAGLGTLLVRLTGESLDDSIDVALLVGAAQPSWIKLSEVVKYALWRDTRRLYHSTSELRTRMREAQAPSSLMFMIAGGVASERGPFEAREILGFIDDDERRAKLETFLREAATCKVVYRDSRAALDAISIDLLARPVGAEESAAAGFLLSQFAAREILTPKLALWAEELVEDQDFSSGSLQHLLDFAMGAQLCGAALPADTTRQLEARIAEEHSVVWYRYDGTKVEMMQVPCEGCSELNDFLVDALADYRRLHPFAELYCGKQLGMQEFVSPEYASLFEKHIPADNLPIYHLTLANKLFLSMCDYDEAAESWSYLANVIETSSAAMLKLSHCLIKTVDKWFDKGRALDIDQELLKAVASLNNVVRDAVITIPKESLDPQGFTRYASPVDIANHRYIDESSVLNNHAQPMRLKYAASFISKLKTIAPRCYFALLHLQDAADASENEQIVRAQIVMLADLVQELGALERELEGVFGRSMLPDQLEEALVNLCCVLNVCLSKKLRKEHSVGYSQKLRAKKLMRCRQGFSDEIVSIEEIEGARSMHGELAFSIDLVSLPEDFSFEGYAARVLSTMFGDLNDVDRLAEAMLLKHYLGDITLDYLVDACFFWCVKISAFQLVSYMETGKEITLTSADEYLERSLLYQHSRCMDAYAIVQQIACRMQRILNVNAELCEADICMQNVTDTYYAWRDALVNDLEQSCNTLEPLMEEPRVAATIGEEGVDGICRIIERVAEPACDSSSVEYLGQLAASLLENAFTEEIAGNRLSDRAGIVGECSTRFLEDEQI